MKMIVSSEEARLIYSRCQAINCKNCILEPFCDNNPLTVMVHRKHDKIRDVIMNQFQTTLIRKDDTSENNRNT